LDSEITINGRTINGDGNTIAILFIVLNAVIASGDTEIFSQEGAAGDSQVHTMFTINPHTRLDATIHLADNDPLRGHLGSNLKGLALKHLGAENELANSLMDD
jgi:hypothetical protein